MVACSGFPQRGNAGEFGQGTMDGFMVQRTRTASEITITNRKAAMTNRAKGPFDVQLAPQPLALEDKIEGATVARMSLDKRYHGDLDARSKGEMLSAMTAMQGSAGYVAIEKVDGTLGGRNGTFVLQHSATMTRGEPDLHILVVPDSGTGELVGLRGSMKIVIQAGGKHFYDFEYELADSK
jgi:hypothetical protein